MFRTRTVSILMLFLFGIFPFAKIFSQADHNTVQAVIHLLSYVSMDYAQAVQNGKVISEQEYKEQKEFSLQAYQLTKEGSFLAGKENEVINELQSLVKMIDEKRPAEDISDAANKIRTVIIGITGIATAPRYWPDLNAGKVLYAAKCLDCHGSSGDGKGKLALTLDPHPTNFLDSQLMSKISPYQAFNTIKLGVQGTGMKGFSELSDRDAWNLAFFIKSLRFGKEAADSMALRKAFNRIYPDVSLEDVATHSDNDLLNLLSTKTKDTGTGLQALRLLSPAGDITKNSLSIAVKNLEEAITNYSGGNRSLARTNALRAYLEGIEPVEARLRTVDPAFVSELEQQMLNVRQAIEKDKGEQAVKDEANKALGLIARADQLMQDQQLNYWITFTLAASIMLREGIEAFLVLAVMLALIRSSGIKKALPWIHGGWITAALSGVAGWYLSDYIIQFGGRNREIMEGLISLIAVVILLYAGFWLHNNSYARQWKKFIEEKVGRYLNGERMFGLALFSFAVVFREAFEVILFLRAVSLEATEKNQSAIGLGVLAAVAAIAIIAYLFLKYSKKIPVRQLFRYSSWLIVLLAIILMGKGVHSIQESGWIAVTGLSSFFPIDWLGIYPTMETLLSQAALIVVIIIAYYISNHRRKKLELRHG
ncbi:MAG: iron permease [Sphingobacteriales bacterium UTBCD1]|nr:MAG: iron permease [Sphingobacteriales bacterium UTBCD1]OQY94405.1 MAG: iron permease [Sphingobacteriales bacterium UTBCD1]